MSTAVKPSAPSTAVATVESSTKPFALRSGIGRVLTSEQALGSLRPLVPHGMDYDLVIAECYRAAVANPDILKCTPSSIIAAVAIVLQTQLVVGKTIYLVPLNTKFKDAEGKDAWEDRLNAWLSFKGEVELVMRAGVARIVDAHCVYEKEPFELMLGTSPNVVHRPIMDPKARGRLIGGYGYAVLAGNVLKVFHMTIDEVDAVRAKSRSWKSLPATPPWYVEKTLIHRVAKTLPTNPALAKVIALLEREEAEDREDDEALDPSKRIEAHARDDGPTIADSAAQASTRAADADGVALATTAQKIRIFELLDKADVDQPTREAKWTTASAATFASDAADAMIAELEKLVPPQHAHTDSPQDDLGL